MRPEQTVEEGQLVGFKSNSLYGTLKVQVLWFDLTCFISGGGATDGAAGSVEGESGDGSVHGPAPERDTQRHKTNTPRTVRSSTRSH